MNNLGQFVRFDGLQGLAALLEGLEGLDDGLGHAAVGLLGATDDGELLGGGQPLVAVGMVEADAQEVNELETPAEPTTLPALDEESHPSPQS